MNNKKTLPRWLQVLLLVCFAADIYNAWSNIGQHTSQGDTFWEIGMAAGVIGVLYTLVLLNRKS